MWRMSVLLSLGSLVLVGLLTGCTTKQSLKKAEGYYKEGVAQLKTDEQRAFVSFQKSIKENADHRDAHYLLGHLFAKQGKYELAEKELREALRVDPDYSEAFTYLGQVLAHQGRWNEAVDAYRLALENPMYETPDLARFHLGRALAHEGNMKGAIEAYEEARLVSPANVNPGLVHLELGRAYYKIGDDIKARRVLSRVATYDKEGAYTEEAGQLLSRLRR